MEWARVKKQERICPVLFSSECGRSDSCSFSAVWGVSSAAWAEAESLLQVWAPLVQVSLSSDPQGVLLFSCGLGLHGDVPSQPSRTFCRAFHGYCSSTALWRGALLLFMIASSPPQTVVFMALKYPSDGGISHLVLSCLELLQDTEGASAVAEKQHKVLTELKREQVMLQEQLGLIASNCPPPPQLHAALGGGWSKI